MKALGEQVLDIYRKSGNIEDALKWLFDDIRDFPSEDALQTCRKNIQAVVQYWDENLTRWYTNKVDASLIALVIVGKLAREGVLSCINSPEAYWNFITDFIRNNYEHFEGLRRQGNSVDIEACLVGHCYETVKNALESREEI